MTQSSFDKKLTTGFRWEGPLLRVDIEARSNELGFLRRFAAAVVALGWEIHSGTLETKPNNSVVDVFYLAPVDRNTSPQEQLRQVSEIIDSVLSDGLPPEEVFVRYKVDSLKDLRHNKSPKTKINVYDDKKKGGVCFHIQTEDRRGLLYTIATVFAQNDVDIRRADIKTISNKGRAEDTFYVLTRNGDFFGATALAITIREDILAAL